MSRRFVVPCFASAAVFLTVSCTPSPEGIIVYDTPPAVSLIEPLDGSIWDEGEPIIFRGLVSDNSGVANLELQWASSIDGILLDTDTPDPNGSVELATASLAPGAHVITLRAFDPGAQQGEARVNVVIEGVPEAPSIVIERPVVGEDALEGESFRYMVKVEDAQDPEPDLLVELRSDVDGFICSMVPDSTGIAYCEEFLSLGEHLLTFSVVDTEDNENHASVVFDVVSLLDFDGDRDGWTPNQGDCEDNNNTIHPGAQEICDNLDNDCSPITPIDANTICYDDDGDNFCEAPPCRNASGTQSDCNDQAPGIYPGAGESPNGVDDDCDGLIDDGLSNYDDDGDGYCETPPCVNASGTEPDCDDERYLVNPAQPEICRDGLDNNCNFNENEQNALGCTNFYIDEDGDTFGIPGSQQCWCEAGGAAWPYGATNTRDCYDNNANARPGQSQFFSAHRGDGLYDFDCDNAQTPQYVNRTTCNYGGSWSFSCDDNGNGWDGSIPSCGQPGDWVNGCDLSIPWIAYVICIIDYGLTGSSLATCVLQNGGSCNKEYGSGRIQGCR